MTRPLLRWQCRDRTLLLGSRTHVMGILNVTPDSFSDGGKYLDSKRAIEHGLQMARDGADIIDVGGESTRPGSDAVPVEEEIWRVVPVIEALSRETDRVLSVDTNKARVAEKALAAARTSSTTFRPSAPTPTCSGSCGTMAPGSC
jgi:dihydropteroate synthase